MNARLLGMCVPSTDDGVARRMLSRRLTLEPPPRYPSPFDFVPRTASLSAVVGPPCLHSPPPPTFNGAAVPSVPDALVHVPAVPGIDIPKAKVPFSVPAPFFIVVFLVLHPHVGHFTGACPKPPLIQSSHYVLILSSTWRCFACRSPLDRHALKAASSDSDRCLALR